MGEDAAGVRGEESEERELLGRECDVLSADLDTVLRAIDAQGPDVGDRRRGVCTRCPMVAEGDPAIYSPYRELTGPIVAYLDELDTESGDDIITVVVPEFVTSLCTQWLHNQSALAIRLALLLPAQHRRAVRPRPRRLAKRRDGEPPRARRVDST